MNVQGTRVERWAAFLLLATSFSAASWVRWEAMVVAGTISAREQQLEHLAIVMAGRHGGAAASLASLDGLFPDHRLVWRPTDAGAVLTLSHAAEARR